MFGKLFAKPGEDARRIIDLDEINCLVSGRHGWFLANRFDHYLGLALVRYGEYGETEHQFLASLLRPGDNVVEIGANIGSHTVGLCKAVGTAGSVVAIEPQPAIFRVLCANLALNGLQNAATFMLGCGEQQGTMNVPAYDYHVKNPHNSGGVSLEASGSGHQVAIMPLDALLAESPALRLLKIDVEGMELEALAGASRLIEKHRPLLYVENDRIEKSRTLVEWILAQGYRLWWHTPPLFNPDNFFGESENLYANIVSVNLLCVPKEFVLSQTANLRELTDPGFHLLKP